MDSAMTTTLEGWHNFYAIAGTAAATLTGLQFVVQTLLASTAHRLGDLGDPEGGIEAFGTPTVVHLTLALIISAALCVPWNGYGGLRGTLVVLALAALVYSGAVLRRTRRQRSYVPVLQDWLWHLLLPGAAYAGVLLAAVDLGGEARRSLFVIAGATLLLICVGIHNAWDTVTYITVSRLQAFAPQIHAAESRDDA